MADVFDLLRDLSERSDLAAKFARDPDGVISNYTVTDSQKSALKQAQQEGSMSPVCDMLSNAVSKGNGGGIFC
ncbi:MAG: hypothetical protein KJO98_06705 [Rhodothermia bacterium]|nr:hypothetical protein [Rhodothermia bacterium]